MTEDFHVTIEGVETKPPSESANIDITDVSTNSPVVEGGDLEFEISYFNTSDETVGVEPAVIVIDETVTGTTEELGDGLPGSQTLTVPTQIGDAGSYVAAVTVGQATTSVNVEITSAEAGVTIISTTSPAEQGNSIDVTANITNPLAVQQSFTPELFIYKLTDLIVGIKNTNSPVAEGDDLDVRVSVENPTDTLTPAPVSLNVDGTERDSLTGGPGFSADSITRFTLTWNTSSGDAGDYTIEVGTPGDSATETVTVLSS